MGERWVCGVFLFCFFICFTHLSTYFKYHWLKVHTVIISACILYLTVFKSLNVACDIWKRIKEMIRVEKCINSVQSQNLVSQNKPFEGGGGRLTP